MRGKGPCAAYPLVPVGVVRVGLDGVGVDADFALEHAARVVAQVREVGVVPNDWLRQNETKRKNEGEGEGGGGGELMIR